MLSNYLWRNAMRYVSTIETAFGFEKVLGLKDKEPKVLYVTEYLGGKELELQQLFFELDDKAMLPFVHLIVANKFNDDEYEILSIQKDMTSVNYAYDASCRVGLIIVESEGHLEDASLSAIELLNLEDLYRINTGDLNTIELGFDISMIGS